MIHYDETNDELKLNVSLTQQIAVSVSGSKPKMTTKKKILEISNQNEVYYLHPETILYVEADGNYCDIHLTDGDVLETVSFQRAEIARKIDTQLPREVASMFSLLGKPYLVNIEHIMHINAQRQQLTFDINQPGTCKKKSIKATPTALRNLRQALDEPIIVSLPKTQKERKVNGGFANYMTTSSSKKNKNYDIEDDEVMILGR